MDKGTIYILVYASYNLLRKEILIEGNKSDNWYIVLF